MSTQFKYDAVDETGARHAGVLAAHAESNVHEFIISQQWIPISIEPVKERRAVSFFGLLSGTDFEKLIMFTNQLSTLHKAGIPLLRSLALIRIGKTDSRFNQVIDEIRDKVQSGKQLSEAMSDYPDFFSGVYVASVSAGEESGKLEYTLEELSSMLDREMALSRQLRVATRYPLVVISILITACIVMMIFVVPRFVAFYSSFGTDLPLPTRILIGTSHLFTHYWPLLLGGTIALVFGFRKFLDTEKGRMFFDEHLLKMPIFGDLIVKSNVARFTLMFRMLFRAGIPVIRSIDLLHGTIKNVAVAAEVRRINEILRTGQDLSGAITQFKYFPEVALQLMSIGLESGSLETMLHEVGNHYAKEVTYQSKQLTTIIEPILTVVLGLFVLVLALAIFLPMWNLIQVFRH